MATFPSYLRVLQWREKNRPNIQRTPTESVYTKQGKRFGGMYIEAQTSLLMTKAQYATFSTWVEDNGYDTFSFNRLVDGNSYTMQIKGGEFDADRISSIASHYVVQMVLEFIV